MIKVALLIVTVVLAQSAPAQFEVVSIRRHAVLEASGGITTLPDGTMVMTNQPIRSILGGATPVPVRQIVGYPAWVDSERYDVTTKPPAGTTPAQGREMMAAMFAERMKLVGHVEQREQDGFALVLARSDRRLGPQLNPSALDCAPRPAGTPPPPPPTTPVAGSDVGARCGMSMSGEGGTNSILSGGINMDRLARALEGAAGGVVNNRTGLEGWFAVSLKYATGGRSAGSPAGPDDPPEIFTAVQEQLGLKLQREKTTVPVFVVDHIERPTEN